jgi:hypothetical protein
MAGGMAQVVECLSSKHEALKSNPNTATHKKNCFQKWKIYTFSL